VQTPTDRHEEEFYRQLRVRSTAAALAVFFFPFTFFSLLVTGFFSPGHNLQYAILHHLIPPFVLGVCLSLLTWRFVLRRVQTELERTISLVHLREHERDLAQEELTRRLMEERDLVREKLQFEAQLAEYEKYAALAQLALGAAHEINNPLLGILSHLELELRTTTDPEAREEIEQCIAGTKRISSTIRGLLDYARPGPLLLSKISLERLVSETLSFIQHQPMLRGITLEKNFPPDLPPISADSNQVSQVLMNLLLNAAQATKDGGKITITAEKVKFKDEVELRISDTGSGIPADILPHVFEPFFTTKRGQGTGLGLSISQAYVRSHGGDISVESIPDRGTTVRVILPMRHEGRPVAEQEEVIV
jgi:signal transduction histidine kinase